MRGWIPSLVGALSDEIAEVSKRTRIQSILLSGGEPRDLESTRQAGVSAIWYRNPNPDLAINTDEPFGHVRIGNATHEAAIIEVEPDRILISIEHPDGPLTAYQNAELILDPTALLKTLQQRLTEADQGTWEMSWTLLAKVQGSINSRAALASADACDLSDLSEEQARVVRLAMGSEVTFVQGPPGTGKTHTAARIVSSAIKARKSILVTSHTHVAIDQVLMSCVGAGGPVSGVDQKLLVRVGQPRLSTVPKNLVANSASDAPKDALIRGGTFATLSKIYVDQSLLQRSWDLVLIDEVSMVNPALAMMALGRAQETVVLVGDPHQLPPITRARREQAKAWLGTDLFERCGATARSSFTRITTQRRMKPAIANIARDLRYGREELVDHPSTSDRTTRIASVDGHPLMKVSSVSARTGAKTLRYQGSMWNLQSAVTSTLVASQLARGLTKPSRDERKPIGVVTPYRAQSRLVMRLLSSMKVLPWVRPGTVHTFQGNECDVIVLDPTLGPPINSARLTSSTLAPEVTRELNVAVTRARDSVIMTGDHDWLQTSGRQGALGSVVRHFRNASDFTIESSMESETYTYSSSCAAALRPIEPRSTLWALTPEPPERAAAELLSSWGEFGAKVYAVTNPDFKSKWIVGPIEWIPWLAPPHGYLSDQGLAIRLADDSWIGIKSPETAELVASYLRLPGAIDQLLADPRCICGERRHVRTSVKYQGDEVFLTCPRYPACRDGYERVRNTFVRFKDSKKTRTHPKNQRSLTSSPSRSTAGDEPVDIAKRINERLAKEVCAVCGRKNVIVRRSKDPKVQHGWFLRAKRSDSGDKTYTCPPGEGHRVAERTLGETGRSRKLQQRDAVTATPGTRRQRSSTPSGRHTCRSCGETFPARWERCGFCGTENPS